MKELFQNKYRVESRRAQWWDYGANSAYFITICTHERKCCFGEINCNIMKLSKVGQVAYKFWNEIPLHFSFVILDAFIVMPNHLHGILIINKNIDSPSVDARQCLVSKNQIDQSSVSTKILSHGQKRAQNQGRNTISSIVGSYKSVVSKKSHCINKNFKWQPRFYENIIRNSKSYNKIKEYISNNPINWKEDKLYKTLSDK